MDTAAAIHDIEVTGGRRRHAPDQRHDGDDTADDGHSVGVFGAATYDSRLFGGPTHNSGLLDAPECAPGDVPGLFDRRGRATATGAAC